MANKKNRDLHRRLAELAKSGRFTTKGPLCVALHVTRMASRMSLPLKRQDFLAPQGGQVAGQGKANVQAVLADHGITRILAEEGGRTSRGSIGRMEKLVAFLNHEHASGSLDFEAMEAWWVERVKEHFASRPFRLKVDASKGLRAIVSDLLGDAYDRQKECPGTMVAGAVMQHLVGAKLEVALPSVVVEHNGFSVADSPSGRKGDFLIGDTAVHVTTAPGEALIRKCRENLGDGLRPVVITTELGVSGAMALATNEGIQERMDILGIEQFVATNVYEWTAFQNVDRRLSVRKMIDAYNRIVSECETDPSLKISLS